MNDQERINLLLGCLWNLRRWAGDEDVSAESVRQEIDGACETVGLDLETWDNDYGKGYVCQVCRIMRPSNWFVYEVEKDGVWLTPCCAMCARENRSRGPFPQNAEA